MIRPANESDLPLLYRLAERFVEESALPLTFDLTATHETLYRAIKHEDQILLVDYEDKEDVLCGGILGHVHRDFNVERCAYVSKMYVDKEFRGLGTARDLVEAFELEARRLGAKVVFASATAGMGQRVEKLFVRLFEKYGYDVLGRVVFRDIS